MSELSGMFGGASVTVGSIMGTASIQMAASRFIAELALEHSDNIGQYLELMKVSGKLGDSAARNEVLAYELCAKESGVKRLNHADRVPWLDDIGRDG